VSTGKSITVDEAFKMVVRKAAIVTGNRVDIKYSPWPSGVSQIELRSYISDVSSIAVKLGWRPTTILESGIDRMIDKISERVKYGRKL
jgi:nucleoside-diphosphate-sugar epimerase